MNSQKLLEDIVHWEHHTQINQSLESIIRENYDVIDNFAVGDGVISLLNYICSKNFKEPEDIFRLKEDIDYMYTISKK
jgi:hypothetical protein